ncbi:MAG: hypothetical protein LUI12_07645 [Clostridiales bacterium]|nr:hypothetical protein [Clostridiales bacterium]
MKILKNVLTAIGIMAILLCAFIFLCAINPNITETLAELVSQDEQAARPQSMAREETPLPEEAAVPDETEADVDSVSQSGRMLEALAGEKAAPENMEAEPVRGSGGYEAPSEADIVVPKAVNGKAGYQPITERTEELPGAEGGEYTSELGYGETGDGLVFDAAFYPYYQMLDTKGQHLYRQIYANANALNKAFVPVEAVPASEMRNIICAVYNDHPELFWMNTAYVCKYDRNKICAELELDFNETADDLDSASEEFDASVNEILEQVQNLGSNYEKEKAVHDILIDKITYRLNASMSQSAYSALVNGETVCAGYARAFQYLLQKLGIPCYYCTGYAGEDHAWNIVALEDGYYNVDVTWDDTPGGEYDYFNRTDQDYAQTHVRRELSVNLPPCNGQQYRNLEQSGETEEPGSALSTNQPASSFKQVFEKAL